jgi:hypothetical protein
VHIIKTFPNCYWMRPFITSRVRSRSVIVETALEFVMWDYTSCTFILLALHYIRRPRSFLDITAFTLHAACCDVVPLCNRGRTGAWAWRLCSIKMKHLFCLELTPGQIGSCGWELGGCLHWGQENAHMGLANYDVSGKVVKSGISLQFLSKIPVFPVFSASSS